MKHWPILVIFGMRH